MAAEHEIGKLLPADHAKDVLYVRLEVDGAVHQMGSLAVASQGGCIDFMPSLSQTSRNTLVAPATVPGSVHQDKCRHGDPLSCCGLIADSDTLNPYRYALGGFFEARHLPRTRGRN